MITRRLGAAGSALALAAGAVGCGEAPSHDDVGPATAVDVPWLLGGVDRTGRVLTLRSAGFGYQPQCGDRIVAKLLAQDAERVQATIRVVHAASSRTTQCAASARIVYAPFHVTLAQPIAGRRVDGPLTPMPRPLPDRFSRSRSIIRMPRVVGLSIRDASIAMCVAGFRVRVSSGATTRTVASQRPVPGSRVLSPLLRHDNPRPCGPEALHRQATLTAVNEDPK
jgi:hypothetical protein